MSMVKSPTKVNTDHYKGDLKTCDFFFGDSAC